MLRGLDYLSSSFSSRYPFLRRLLSSGASSSSASPPPELALETQQPELPPSTAIAAMDLETGERSPPPAVAGRREDGSDARRVAKLVQPVALAAAAGSLVLFVNAPPAADGHRPELHAAYLAFVCLGLFTSLGLSMHAVVRSGDPAVVAALHKRLLLLAIAFVLCAAVVRFSLVLPGAVPLQVVT
ncbi:uncharacterized protein LOC109710214 [Ananas comosus]|uniref:Uncharacterized protein LOC109710214 n=1 Tax=Ananas comosus TaxID=4615 RepID=A0A6P5EXQ4_ANACO|nr:uncharacterized protein LOC109710214 [Ananas comosus]